jgi:hypothetical protein
LGIGVYGYASTTSGTTYGVLGWSESTAGHGVHGWAIATSGATYGVYGQSDSTAGRGVFGEATADSGATYGVFGQANSPDGCGVFGYASHDSFSAYGVYGESVGGSGVYGRASTTSGLAYGGYFLSTSSSGTGVLGWAVATSGLSFGVFGRADSTFGYAGFFSGNVHVDGTLSKTGGSFKIDHPLDPANKYLYHSFVESPDMMNIYNGVVVLDEEGTAWVELPDWFEALNVEFRYQLTCIGGYAPVYIAQEIEANHFQIAGGTPQLKVSWQVTGIRQDPWAEANRIPVEQDKPAEEQGTYLHPELYGQPKELGLDYQRHQGWEQPAAPEVPPPDAVPE